MAKAYLEVDYLSGDEPRTARTNIGSYAGQDDLTLEHERERIRAYGDELLELAGEYVTPSFVDHYRFQGDAIAADEYARLGAIFSVNGEAARSYRGC